MSPPIPLSASAQNPTPSQAQASGNVPRADSAAARAAAEEFEAVFLSQMIANMFSGIETDSMFGGGPAEDIYRAMMVQEYGKVLARTGGVGIADAVVREFLRVQEGNGQ